MAARGRRSFFVNAATFALLTLACAGPAFSVDWTRFEPTFWRDVVVSGVLCAVGNACLVAALGRGELSILGPINAWKAVVGLTFGFFLLGETPTAPALGGVFLIGVGSYFVLDASPERFSFRLLLGDAAIRLRVAALILTALEAIFIKKIVLAAGPSTAFFLWSATGTLFSTLSLGVATLIPTVLTRLRRSSRTAQNPPTSQTTQTSPTPPTSRLSARDALELAATAASVGAMQLSTNFVFERLEVGLALSLFQLSALLNVLLGWRLFRERGVVKKLFGATITVVGASCVVLFG
ncbi:MAG: EamA family transporter [Thermoguttaceae bacterium]|nr:EamA family transporter [Thermoguttaceae bacterium]